MNSLSDNRILHLIHLDDHQLFRDGVRECILEKSPNIFIEGFPSSDKALVYIFECFQNKTKIDLIITDFNHLGENGFMFAKQVREIEKSFDIRTPLILYTMVKSEVLIKEIEEGVFDSYYSKAASREQVSDFIKNHCPKY